MKVDEVAILRDTPSSSLSPVRLTFLIADIRGYTRFTAEHGDVAAARLATRFAELCELGVNTHRGKVIELRGDEALCVFPSAHGALQAAVELQAMFRETAGHDPSLPLHVGIGLDAGEAIPVRGGYRGGSLNLAARLCGIAGRDETFASTRVIDLAGNTTGIDVVDRGEVALKGLANRVRVLQIAVEGELPAELPPLDPALRSPANNLPDEPTPFIGREEEISRITWMVRDPTIRLVTLTGTGGTGKTRLALQVAATLLHEFRDGVFFCDLSQLANSALVPSTITAVLDLKEEAGRPLTETLGRHLQDKQVLLVLDNFEHLLDACAMVATLLDGCRMLTILVTSRTPLHLTREHEWPVSPLAVPDSHSPLDLEALARYDAITLFIGRARAVKPNFALTASTAPAVVDICHRLDGLPLAIELAAARIKLFPPQALLPRLSNRLALLTGGARDLPSRQRTLRDTLDWSYSLLTPEEQLLYARLSVFAGGCSLAAVEAVCNQDGALDLLPALDSLVDKSLLRQDGEEEPRFSFLETLREYASEQCATSGETTSISIAHSGYYTALAEAAGPALLGAEQALWLERLQREHENLRTALTWSLAEGSTLGLRLAAYLGRFWQTRGYRSEGRRWLEAVLADSRMSQGDPAIRARALNAAGYLSVDQSDFLHATPLLEECLRLRRELGDIKGVASTLGNLGTLANLQGNFQRAAELYEESLQLRQELGDTWGIAAALINLSNIASNECRYQEAARLLEEGLQLACELDDASLIGFATGNLGVLARRQGEYQRAEVLHKESLRMKQEIGDRGGIASSLAHLGELAWLRGEHGKARDLYAQSIRLQYELGDQTGIAYSLGDWPAWQHPSRSIAGQHGSWAPPAPSGGALALLQPRGTRTTSRPFPMRSRHLSQARPITQPRGRDEG